MKDIIQENIILNWKDVKPIELERILNLYGMKKSYYCNLYGKSRSWWYNVLITKKYLAYTNIKVLADSIGVETFNMLLEKVRKQYPQKN